MRVFVAGASGAIGRPLIGQLIEAGHEVTGMTRREDRAAEIRGRGADCVVCDVFTPRRSPERWPVLARGSNGKAKRELGWQPGYPSWCQGFEQALG